MDIKEARALAKQARIDIGHILDDLYEKTGILITNVEVTPTGTTALDSIFKDIRYMVVLSSHEEF
jgi:hypothetical protein